MGTDLTDTCFASQRWKMNDPSRQPWHRNWPHQWRYNIAATGTNTTIVSYRTNWKNYKLESLFCKFWISYVIQFIALHFPRSHGPLPSSLTLWYANIVFENFTYHAHVSQRNNFHRQRPYLSVKKVASKYRTSDCIITERSGNEELIFRVSEIRGADATF